MSGIRSGSRAGGADSHINNYCSGRRIRDGYLRAGTLFTMNDVSKEEMMRLTRSEFSTSRAAGSPDPVVAFF